MEKREPVDQRTPDEKIRDLLVRKPSGPEFEQSTITYTNDVVEASLEKVLSVLLKKFPDAKEKVNEWAKDFIDTFYGGKLPEPCLLETEDGIVMATPKGKRIPAKPLTESVYWANPRLGSFNHLTAFFTPQGGQSWDCHYPWFNSRFGNILTTGGLQASSPEARIIAAGYITQVAKNRAADEAKKLLAKMQVYGGVTELKYLDNSFDKVSSDVKKIRHEQTFIREGLKTIDTVADEAGLDETQVQLLLDLAFIRNKAVTENDEFQDLLKPIVRLIADGDWEAACEHRDFLLKYLGKSFPDWRKRRFEKESGEVSFNTLKDLSRAVAAGKVSPDEMEIPSAYVLFFPDLLARKSVTEQRRRNDLIVNQSAGLSTALLHELFTCEGIGFPRDCTRPLFVETMNDRQMLWYETANVREYRDEEGNVYLERKAKINVGKILHKVIDDGLVDIDGLFDDLYERQREKDPRISEFTLGEYVRAVLAKSGFTTKEIDEDPACVSFFQAQKERESSR